MAIKYRLEFNDFRRQDWKVEINVPSYEGNVIDVWGEGEFLTFEWQGNNDDNIYRTHVIPSSATITINSSGVDIDELMSISDGSFTTKVYLNGVLYWQGYAISDGITEIDSGTSYPIVIRSIDGLELLPNINFLWSSNFPAIRVDGKLSELRCPLNAVRNVVFGSTNLNNRLPIRWNTSIKNDAYPDRDFMAGAVTLNNSGEMIRYKENTAHWWLEEIAKSSQSWFYQYFGKWYLMSYEDLINNNGVFKGYEISDDTTSIIDAVPINENMKLDNIQKEILSATEATYISKKPLSKVTVSYSAITNKENVAPNGDFDIVNVGTPAYWGAENGKAYLNSYDPINGEKKGSSVESFNPSGEDDYITFKPVPIETSILYKTCLIGFKWCPVSGYALKPNTTTIDFDKVPLTMSIKYTIGTDVYFLNEFGYWWNKDTAMSNQRVTRMYYTTGTTNEIGVEFVKDVYFNAGDEYRMIFLRDGLIEFYNVVFTSLMLQDEGVNYISSKIPNSYATVSEKGRILRVRGATDSPQNSATMGIAKEYYENIIINGGENLKLNDILDVQFQSKGSASNIKIPSGIGYMSAKIKTPKNSVMIVDDFFIQVNEAVDESELSIDGNNSGENYNLEISSNENGFCWSNYMTKYTESMKEMNFNGGKNLTRLYGENVLRMRAKPRKIFSGSIDMNVPIGRVFSLYNKNYIPMSVTFRALDGDTTMTASQVDYEDISITHKRKNGAEK